MTRQEFIDKTGWEITEDEMGALHEVYGLGPGDKDTFCEMCVKGGGSLVDDFISRGRSIGAERNAAMKAAVAPYAAKLAAKEKENATQAEEISTLNKELEELQQFVFKTSLTPQYLEKPGTGQRVSGIPDRGCGGRRLCRRRLYPHRLSNAC